ncbi:claudin-12 isoform X2 [Opisthocomus hoazin]|uniref:claudin-12 isoform X2 n=1 Tax=Opisthocomus hoazin TaxID=30419 RepID=UPI003F52EC5E
MMPSAGKAPDVLAGSGSSKALRLDSVLSRSFAELGTVRLVSRRTKSWLVALVLGQLQAPSLVTATWNYRLGAMVTSVPEVVLGLVSGSDRRALSVTAVKCLGCKKLEPRIQAGGH